MRSRIAVGVGVVLALGAVTVGVLELVHEPTFDIASIVAIASGATLGGALWWLRTRPTAARKAATAGAVAAGVCLWWTGVAPALAASYVALSTRRRQDTQLSDAP